MATKTQTEKLIKQVPAWKIWCLAARPKTLPISFVPIMVGTAFAFGDLAMINWFISIMALLSSLLIQIGTNLTNDALDFKKGADREGRLGPQRVTQGGLLSIKAVLMGGFLSFALALLCGIPLIMIGGWPLFAVLLVSVLCGYLYTGGPYPLAYIGISGLFILLFFGWVSTMATYFLQTGTINFSIFLAGTQIGLLAIVPHDINNLRDCDSDARCNKRTLAVRFGPFAARMEITLLSLLPFLLGFLWIYQDKIWVAVLPLAALFPILKNLKSIWKTAPSKQYNQFLAISALSQLLFGLLLAMGVILPALKYI